MGSSSNTILRLMTVAFVLVLASVGNTFAAGSLATKYDRPELSTPPQEEVKKLKGVVVKRDPDAFTMSETTGGPTTTVILTAVRPAPTIAGPAPEGRCARANCR